jgi:hypothetical protein
MRNVLATVMRIHVAIKTCVCSLTTTKRVAVVTAAVALMSLTGIPAASAQTGYTLCTNLSGTAYCLVPSAHGYPAYLSEVAAGSIVFINRYVTPNGNAWWELQSVEYGLCLNWAPAGPDGDLVYWDSCQAGDANELFYNHVPGQLINLAGNETFDLESYLQPNVCSGLLCNLSVYTDPAFKEWAESPDT